MSRFLMGLDAGGRSVRCSLVDVESGRVVAASRQWGPRPDPGAGFFAFTLDPEHCWRLICAATRDAITRAGADPGRIVGIATTGMRFSLVVTDAEDGALLAVPNHDARAAAEAMRLAEEHGPLLNQRTGHWPSPIFAAPRLQWLAVNAPDAHARAACAFSLNDWIGLRLTGVRATDPTHAAETLLYDIHARGWAWDLVDLLEIPRGLLPPVRDAGTLLGPLSRRAADELGVAPETPVVVGGADTQCGLLGAGAVNPGQMAAIAGSTTPVQLVTERPTVDVHARSWAGCHLVPGRWVIESNAGAMGNTLEWFAGVLYPDSPDPVARMIADAGTAAPGAGGVVSSAGAEIMNARELSLPVSTISLTHLDGLESPARRGHVCRAILEGMAYSIKANAAQVLAVAEIPGGDVRIAGGAARSDLWMQIICDILGEPIWVSTEPGASALGAAMCAGVGVGVFADLIDGAESLGRVRPLTPDPERARTYAALHERWLSVQEARAPADALCAEGALQAMMERAPERGASHRPPPPLRILATADLDEQSLLALGELGHVTHECYRDTLRVLAGEDLADALQGYDVLITEVDMLDASTLVRAPDLRVVASCRGQAVNIHVAACTAFGIPVLHAPGRNADSVADLTLALTLMLARDLVAADAFLRRPGGEAGDMARQGQAHAELRGHELGGLTVGLVGLGAVGRAVTKRLRPFGARVLAHDPFARPEDAHLLDAELVTLEELLRSSDVVSLHAPLTDDTRGLIGRAGLDRMRPGSYLINTARAALVDEEALLEALRSGHLAGAAIDVFSEEPPASDHPLLTLPTVIATPHIAGNAVEVAGHQGRIIADDLARLVDGRPPRHVLNPETLARFSWLGERPAPDATGLAALAQGPAPAVSDLQLGARAPQAPDPAALDRVPDAGGATGGPAATPDSPAGRMERILGTFLERAATDRALSEFAATHTVVSQYTVSDLGLEYHVGFREGRVVAGLGPPPEPAEVRMKAKAEVLDGILTGRVNGTRAAMTGKLSFSGDVRVAMGMQRIQGDLIRLYSAAREEAGGLDLSPPPFSDDGPLPGAAPPGEAPGRGTPPIAQGPGAAEGGLAAPAVPTGLRGEIVDVVDELFAAQLITTTGGNVSARIPGTGDIWITPSRLHKGRLGPESLVRIDLQGGVLEAGAAAPSSEWQLHCEIYRARADIEAVIHAHAMYATILALSGLPFVPVTTEAAFLGDIPRVPFIMPGSRDLAVTVRQALGGGTAVFLQNHGLVVAGGSLRQAADATEVVERTCRLLWGCYTLGKKPSTLPKDVLATLRDIGAMTV